jgi:hypothetical protein
MYRWSYSRNNFLPGFVDEAVLAVAHLGGSFIKRPGVGIFLWDYQFAFLIDITTQLIVVHVG